MSADHKEEKGILKFLTDIPKIIYIIILIGLATNFIPSKYIDNLLKVQQLLGTNNPGSLEEINKATSSNSNIVAGDYKITRVIDGDTIVVQDINDNKSKSSEGIKVRLLGINTPESVDPRRPVECFGKEASDYMKSIGEGQVVKLETDESQAKYDKYGRLLAYIYLSNGSMLNQIMIQSGFAYEYTYDSKYKYQNEFKSLENYAKENNIGLWNANTCNGTK